MSFSKAPLRRFNDIQDYATLTSPVYCPRFITSISKVAHCKRRLSNDAHHICTPSMISSTSSSLSYTSSNIQLVKNNKNQTTRTSFAPMPRQKSQNVKLFYKKEKQDDSGIWSSSSVCNNPIRKFTDSKVRANVPSQLQLKSSSMLEESVAFEIISSGNEKERRHYWLETITDLQRMIIRIQKSTSILEDQITELKENRCVLEMKNQALESIVGSLQCKLEVDQCYQQKENEKISTLTRTIENLKTSEEQLKRNFETVEKENQVLCKTMANFVTKILHSIVQESIWKRKEKAYMEAISNLDDIIDENHNLLFETEERLKVLVDELENNSRFFDDKLRDFEMSHQC